MVDEFGADQFAAWHVRVEALQRVQCGVPRVAPLSIAQSAVHHAGHLTRCLGFPLRLGRRSPMELAPKLAILHAALTHATIPGPACATAATLVRNAHLRFPPSTGSTFRAATLPGAVPTL